MTSEEIRWQLAAVRQDLKQTIQLQESLTQMLEADIFKNPGVHILADVVKTRIRSTDLLLMSIHGQILEENTARQQNTTDQGEYKKAGGTVFPAQSHEIIDADARQAERISP